MKNENNKNLHYISSHVSSLYRILKTIHDYFPSQFRENTLAALFGKIIKIWKTNGLVFLIKYLKSVRLHCTRYMVGQPLISKVNEPIKVSLDKDHFPKILSHWKPLFKSKSRGDVVGGLTLTTISRAIRRGKEPLAINFDSVTQPSKAYYKSLDNKLLSKIIKRMKIPQLQIKEMSNEDFKIFISAGPDGPSTATALITATKDSFRKILYDLMRLISGEGRRHIELSGFSTFVKGPLGTKVPYNHEFIRKLAIVEDPELKARVIAIFDHYSQNVLSTLSEQLFRSLRLIPSDRTFDQSPGFYHEGQTKCNNQNYYSLDLTAATDRFPIELQLQVLKLLGYTDMQVNAGRNIMVGQEFLYKPSEKYQKGYFPEPKILKYEVGQPMGARSSGPLFTLCHHIVVRYCAGQLGFRDFHDYIILGDDIVIHNNQVAKYYIKVIKGLGVEISDQKSHISCDHYEFAKRGIRNGKEVSPIPLSGIADNIRNIGVVFQIFYELIVERNLFSFSGSFVGTFSSFYSTLSKGQYTKKEIKKLKGNPFKGFRVISEKRVKQLVEPFNFLLRYRNDLTTIDELRLKFIKSISKSSEVFDGMVPSSLLDLKKIFDVEIRQILRELLDKTSSRALKTEIKINKDEDEIIRPVIEKHGFNPMEPYPDPIKTGYNSIKRKFLFVNQQMVRDQEVPVNEVLDAILAYDNDLFTNREGSSKTKRRNIFNRFARKVDKALFNSYKEVEGGDFRKTQSHTMISMDQIKLMLQAQGHRFKS